MEKYSAIYARAVANKGGEGALAALLPVAKSAVQLRRVKDDRVLAEMTKCVFRSGFVWQVVEHKWPAFEVAFSRFDVATCALLGDEDIERLSTDASIIRNGKKIAGVRGNARFISEIRAEHGTFGRFLASWPETDIVGLWDVLKKQGDRLGGNTGVYFLRFIGKDTFMLSEDVVRLLIRQGVVSKRPTARRDLQAVQAAFNRWHDESGRPLCELSRIAACATG